jgi:2-oxoglutarate ferredoxin oxidoreductase subunit alpha
VFVVEQNRDAQLKTLLVNDAGIQPHKLISVLHYDGTPITARAIQKEIAEIVSALNVRPIKKDKAA